MELNTASAAVTFAKKLEDDSRQIYESLSEQSPEWGDVLAAFIRENKRNVGTVDRTYYGVVSDALDTQFAFQGVDTDDYVVKTALPDSPDGIVDVLVSNEETIIAFYRAAAEASRSLLADVPRTFDRVASKRSRRLDVLRDLASEPPLVE